MSSTRVAQQPADDGIPPTGDSARPDPATIGFRWINLPRSILDADVPDVVIVVAAAMEDLDNGPDGCFATTGTLAARLDIAVSHVRSARTYLRAWTMTRVRVNGSTGKKLRPDDDGFRVRVPSTGLYGSHKLAPRLLRTLTFVAWCNDRHVKVTSRGVAGTLRSERKGKSELVPVTMRTAQSTLRKLVQLGWVVQRGTGSDTVYHAQAAPVDVANDEDVHSPGNREAVDEAIVHTRGNREAEPAVAVSPMTADPGNGEAVTVPTRGNQAADAINIPGNWEVDGRPLNPPPPETGRRGPRKLSGGDPGNGEAQSRSFEYIYVSTSTRSGASAREAAAIRRARAERSDRDGSDSTPVTT